jgi:hypothetical protein
MHSDFLGATVEALSEGAIARVFRRGHASKKFGVDPAQIETLSCSAPARAHVEQPPLSNCFLLVNEPAVLAQLRNRDERSTGFSRTMHAPERIRLLGERRAAFSPSAPEPREFALIDTILAPSPTETRGVHPALVQRAWANGSAEG